MTQHGELEEVMLNIDGKQEPAYNMANSAAYLGVSQTSLQNILKRRKEANEEIKKHQLGFGKERYILKRDLDDLLRARPS